MLLTSFSISMAYVSFNLSWYSSRKISSIITYWQDFAPYIRNIIRLPCWIISHALVHASYLTINGFGQSRGTAFLLALEMRFEFVLHLVRLHWYPHNWFCLSSFLKLLCLVVFFKSVAVHARFTNITHFIYNPSCIVDSMLLCYHLVL